MPLSENRYCILLKDVLVPLETVPGGLTHRQMKEEGWKLVKEDPEPLNTPTLQAPVDVQLSQSALPTSTTYLPPDHHARRPKIITAEQLSQLVRGTQPVHIERKNQQLTRPSPPELSASVYDPIRSVHPGEALRLAYRPAHIPVPSGISPDPSRKVYCTHWLMRGECAYTQQGCRYKHEMPDLKKLRELGFREVPRWYSERTRIIPGQSSWRRHDMDQDKSERELSTEPPVLHAFRLPILTVRKPADEEMKEPAASKNPLTAVEIENLIDLGDPAPSTPVMTPAMPVSPLLSAAPHVVNTASLLKQHLNVDTSSLRHEGMNTKSETSQGKEEFQPTEVSASVSDGTSCPDTSSSTATPINTPELTPKVLARPSSTKTPSISNSLIDLSSDTVPQAVASGTHNGAPTAKIRDEVPQLKSETQFSTNPSVASSTTKNARPSKPHKKRGPRLPKPAEHTAVPATQGGLAASQHATSNRSRGPNSPSKGDRRRGAQGSGMDLQSQITLRTRAGFEKERLSKGVQGPDGQPRHTQTVASNNVEST